MINKYYEPVEVGYVLCYGGCAITITQVDHSKMEGRFKLHESYKDARDWGHEASLEAHPAWHLEYCHLCRIDRLNAEVKKE